MDETTDPIKRFYPELSLVPGHLQPFITVVVLISGVAGGLILVISVILICKYCFKQKKALKRKPAAYSAASAEEGSSTFIRTYDSTEPSEIQHLYSGELEKDIENGNVEVGKPAEEEEDNIDYYFEQYRELVKDGNGNPVERTIEEPDFHKETPSPSPLPSPSRSAPTPRSSIASAPASGPPSPPKESPAKGAPREPSPPPVLTPASYDVSDPPSVVRNWSFRRDSSKKKGPIRYTDGDYHYLKRMRVQRPPAAAANNPLFRQYSVGGLASSSSSPKIQERYIRSMTDDPTYHYALQDPRVRDAYVMHRTQSVEPAILVPRRESLHREPSPSAPRRDSAHREPSPLVPRRESTHREPSPLISRRESVHREISPSVSRMDSIHRETSPLVPRRDSMHREPSPSVPRRDSLHLEPSPSMPRMDSVHRETSPLVPRRDSIHRETSPLVPRRDSIHRETSPLVPRREPINRELSPHRPMHHNVNRTEVRALVHRSSTSNSSLDTKTSPPDHPRAPPPPRNLSLYPASARHSFSVETVGPFDVAVLGRRVKSYECGLRNEHPYESNNTTMQFDKGPFYNADFDVVSEGGNSPNFRSKVRYNDTGSLEEITGDAAKVMLNEIISDFQMSDPQDDTDTLNGAQKYRDIWSLRATLEEEEDFSDTIRIEDISSPEPSPDHERALSTYTTSFESNTEPCPYNTDLTDSELGSRNHLHPMESRRQDYKTVLSRRFRRIEAKAPAGENSFDSVETMDTDGDVSDTSRPVDTTTSFESTTDNTDSTGDSQTHKLQQMKHDSGYRSLEAQQPKIGKKQIHFAVEQDSIEYEEVEGATPDKSPVDIRVVESQVKRGRNPREGPLERRTGRTASKKRREFSRERQQLVQVYESINEPETDSRSDLPSGDSFDDPAAPSKFSVFSRFFKSHHRERIHLTRDYSIDEKTNRIFNEFLRPDLAHAKARSPRTRRLQRKFTDPCPEFIEYPKNKLCPEMRSTSLGSDSSCASSRRLSPQDSMEEEPFSRDLLMKPSWDSRVTQAETSSQATVSAKQDIPIIRLPEEEISDV